jgi:hypothetical protein
VRPSCDELKRAIVEIETQLVVVQRLRVVRLLLANVQSNKQCVMKRWP